MTNISINLAPNDQGKNIFNPGQTLKGVVHLVLSEPKYAREFYMMIIGEAKCHWTEPSGDDKNSYNGHVIYLFSKTHFLGHKNAEEIEIQVGTHSYSFECELPELIPESLVASHGSIEYRVEAVVGFLLQVDMKEQIPFIVVRNDDLNDYPELKIPVQLEEIKNFSCGFRSNNRSCLMTVKIPQRGFAFGQSIPVTIQCKNKSNIDIDRIVVCLKQRVILTSSSPKINTLAKSNAVVSKSIAGVKRDTFKRQELLLSVPFLTVPSNSRFCSVVTIEYVVHVEAFVDCCHPNFDMKVPITIGKSPIVYQRLSITEFPTAPISEASDEDLSNLDETAGLLKFQTQADVNLSASNTPIGWLVGIEEESEN